MATIIGTPGNDERDGSSLADVIRGLGGNDELDGNGGNDRISGNAGNDELEGGSGNDRLFGGSGNDRLDGGGGNDRLTGGGGADVFEFDTGDGRDVIDDWGTGSDRIELDDDFGYSNFRQVMRDATNVGDDVVFDFGRGTEVTVLDASKSDFSAGDFILF